MKVCLVVCLALAHLAAANIFKRHHQSQQALNLPLAYIDPTSYNQLLDQQLKYQRDQTRSKEDKSQERKYERSSQERSQERYPSNDNMNPETAEISSHEADEQIRVNIFEYQQSPLDAQRIWSPHSALPISSFLVNEQPRSDEVKHYQFKQKNSEEQMKYYQMQPKGEKQKLNQVQPRSEEQMQYQVQPRSEEQKQYQVQPRSEEQKQYQVQPRSWEQKQYQVQPRSEEQKQYQVQPSSEEQKQYQVQPRSEEQKQYQAQPRSGEQKQYQAQPRSEEQKQYKTKKNSKNMKQYQAAYGDNVEWSGIRMAVGPHSPIAEEKDIARIFEDAYKTLKDFSAEEKKTFHEMYLSAAKNEDTQLNATQLLQKYQYAVEEHTVKTDDGYILTLFRIPPKQKTRDIQMRPVVFLMHGLLGSADDWLLSGPGVALAYLLADADYDVWMGNARGNKYSRRHVSKHPAQPEFWQFSNDEIALHDLPAMINHALNTTHQKQMYYVGFSEGTTTFFALASSRPEYNDKIIMMHALSPMVYMSHTRSPLLKMIAPNSPFYERLHQILGHGEFKPTQEVIQTIGGNMLANKFGCKHVASNVNLVMSGMVDNYDPKIVPMIESHMPAGGSTRQMKQYGQAVATTFRRYDYGPAINMKVYGSEQPTKYNMSVVRVPVTLYYSSEDWLAQPMDVEQLQSELPHVEAHQVPQFSHLDFQFSKAAPEAVYQRLIASIEKNQSQQ